MNTSSKIRLRTRRLLAGALALLAGGACWGSPAFGAGDLGSLNSELGAAQQQAQGISGKLASLNGMIASLSSQIALVRAREASVRAALSADRAALVRSRSALARERQVLGVLRARLALAKRLLSRQLLSSYENSAPDLISVLLNANGFNQLLEQVGFLQRAEGQQQQIIQLTRRARAQADGAAQHFARLTAQNLQLTRAALVQSRALAGMNGLLQAKQDGLSRAQAIQRQALGATQSRVSSLRGAIATLQAEQAAAARAAAARAAAAASAAATAPASGAPTGLAPAGAGGEYTIPSSVVLCESGGQDLPPNSAGASGYYQILPSTWKLYGGSGPAAYLAPKSVQDAVASRIWNGGSGASQWVCAGLVGIK